mmetsp:Transcript_24171/g.75357  ORF Transcript_24171/g.75357 Transcript_24171/m.75357 type:complete len:213 (-) Transcript_24171:878-1516(-)
MRDDSAQPKLDRRDGIDGGPASPVAAALLAVFVLRGESSGAHRVRGLAPRVHGPGGASRGTTRHAKGRPPLEHADEGGRKVGHGLPLHLQLHVLRRARLRVRDRGDEPVEAQGHEEAFDPRKGHECLEHDFQRRRVGVDKLERARLRRARAHPAVCGEHPAVAVADEGLVAQGDGQLEGVGALERLQQHRLGHLKVGARVRGAHLVEYTCRH